ncbi:hypothetical protein NX059_009226 [Plenodomus lindquistii]|nr:hypothetical protein NX059_009226 [Plenodomus lindquistii]
MLSVAIIVILTLRFSSATTQVSECACGFLDSRTGAVWTNALIAYGNESKQLPVDSLVAEDFQHISERNWHALYRAGAVPANVRHSEPTVPGWRGGVWTLNLDRPTRDHAVVGASIRSQRRDILFGSFEATLGSPPPNAGRSVIAMRLDYKGSQTINLNVMNTEDPGTAWVSFMEDGEWKGERRNGVNFTGFTKTTINYPSTPWGLVSYRIEWTPDNINYYIGDTLARSIRAQEMPELWPTQASTLSIGHSSVGDVHTSQGPPPNGSYAHLGMIRAFFNSSHMSAAEHEFFDARCDTQQRCQVTDTSLRGSSPYMAASEPFFQERTLDRKTRSAFLLASTCIISSAILLLHALWKRATWRPKPLGSQQYQVLTTDINMSLRTSNLLSAGPNMYNRERYSTKPLSGVYTPDEDIPSTTTPTEKLASGLFLSNPSVAASSSAMNSNLRSRTRLGVHSTQTAIASSGVWTPEQSESDDGMTSLELEKSWLNATKHSTHDMKKLPRVTVKSLKMADVMNKAPKQRIDHLAGLVALASLLVTLVHFCMTFYPATAMPYSDAHYEYERWFYKFVTPYLMNTSWIGPFFTTSTRFLVMNYLKTGDLKVIANKVVTRTPRLIVPCATIAALQYFCINLGAVRWLEHLTSVGWSTWPFVQKYDSFGQFLNALVELMYLIPSGVPKIINTYCIGVLWTIPVQLQNSWTSLLAVIVIREIKTPWKRMTYYAFCILMHWYAMSWGSFFLVGLLIADLDITYNWKPWLYARPNVYYTFMGFVLLLAVGSPVVDSLDRWYAVSFSTIEYGAHPDQGTGRPIRETSDYRYTPWFMPRLTALTFSIGVHLLVELSPIVQRALSNRFLMWVFPHILTLYLIHGLVFWSLGSYMCIQLASLGVPYWINITLVAFCCYAVLFGSLPILTPVLETLVNGATTELWRDATEEPAEPIRTLYPFSPAMFKDGMRNVANPVKVIDLKQN